MSFLPRSLRLLAFAWFALTGFNCVTAVATPVRIMPLGDSITDGQIEPADQGGYRVKLYTALTQQGYTVDFVGTYSDSTNPDQHPALLDKNHQGARGYRVDEVNASIGGWLDSVADPDVILIQIGTNDFLQVWRNETPSGVLAELDTLITNIATRRPFAKIVVSTLILTTYDPAVEAKQVTYNQLIPALVQQHAALGRQVTLLDLHPVLQAGDLYDTVHPTATGYDKIADALLPAVTNVIDPAGTANAPLIASASASADPTKLIVSFSKPIADSATNLANFNISGGVTVTGAVLDATTKRTITLTTSAQTPGEIHTLTVSGVRDRTTQQRLIAPLSKIVCNPHTLSNGSFESSFTGWWPQPWTHLTIKDKTVNPPYTTASGNKMVAFNTADLYPNGVVSQSFPTQVGQTYRLSYDLGVASWEYYWTQQMTVKVQGGDTRLQTTSTFTGIGGSGGTPNVSWSTWNHEFTANSTNSTITFSDDSSFGGSFSKDMLLDNVKIIRAGVGLAVTSTPNAGAHITISPSDLGGTGNGTTGLIRTYSAGTTVTLTAPATAAGRSFQKWQLNGADIAGTHRTITVTLNSNTTLNAVYNSTGPIAPVAVADSYTIAGNTPLVVVAPGVLLNDSDANALPLTAELGTAPTKGTLILNPDGSFTYTSNTNPSEADSFTYRVSNGTQNSAYATVFINNPPVAVNDGSVGFPFLTVLEDSPPSFSMLVLDNDSDPDGDALTIIAASSPHGSVTNSFFDTRLRFTPTANFNGATTISYTISDGNGGTASATVYVNVTPVNDAPVAVNDGSAGSPFLTVAEDSGQSANLSVLANDTDVDGHALTITAASSPNGSVSIVNTNTRLQFTPTSNFNGATTISYTISDGNGGIANATVHVNVTPTNDAPVAIAQSLSVDEDDVLTTTLAGIDVESSPLTFSVASAPVHGTVNLTGAVAVYTPAPDYFGPDSFTFTVSDGTLTSAPALVSIAVNPLEEFTQWLGQNNLPPPSGGNDPDGDSVSNMIEYVIGGDPTNASDAGRLPTVAVGSSVPGQVDCLVLTYRRTIKARDDPSAGIKVEWATTLTGPWIEADGTHGETFTVEENAAGPGIDLVHVRVPCPPGSDGRLFSRLSVTINLP